MTASLNIDGVVLAAGASTRMNQPKALLEIDGRTFLERAIRVLRAAGCRYVVAVVRDNEWAERLADVSGAAIVINDDPAAEQIDSLRLGIQALPDDADAVLVLPVDCPRVLEATIRSVIDEFRRADAPILNPSYNGEAGHPVLFARRVLPELLSSGLRDGARSIMSAHDKDARVIEVSDAGVLIDIDTPADYRKHVTESQQHDRD